MKKFVVMILSLITLVFFATNSIAVAGLNLDYTAPFADTINLGSLKNIEFATYSNQDKVSVFVDDYRGYKVFNLAEPNRIVLDVPATSAPVSQQTIDVNSKFIKTIRYAQYDNNTARVVLDLVGQPQYRVEERLGKIVIHVMNPIADNIVYYRGEDAGKLLLSGIKLIDDYSQLEKLYTERYELLGRKYTVTFPSSLVNLPNKIVRVDDGLISMVQILNNKVTQKTSISFYSKVALKYKLNPNSEIGGTEILVSQPVGLPDDSGTGKPITAVNINCSTSTSSDVVTISANSYSDYKLLRLTDPDRVVIDIPNAYVSATNQIIGVVSSRIKTVRYAQYDANTVRVVIDTKGLAQFRVEERTGQLVLIMENPTYKNIVYHNSGDRVYFTLGGAKLTEGGQDLTKFYTGSYDPAGKNYTITFPSSLADIGSGIIKVYDSRLDTVEIKKDVSSGNTSITFNAKDSFVYEIMTRPSVNNTAITILKPFTRQDKLVVIDPGHGDTEPGATYGSLQEKTLNLDISMRLNKILKSKNIKTYMTREDDSYVGLYERAYIANDLNATLFLCVHNNAYMAADHGTETLYYPGRVNDAGFSSKRFAQIIQSELVSSLNTYDRGLKERPELVVLKATKMPAALAEVAFLTNTAERARLQDENFRQKAAEALSNAVIKALGEN